MGAFSSVMDSQISPCLCVDVHLKSGGGDVVLWRNPMGKKQMMVKRGVVLGLRSSFVDPDREWRLCVTRSAKKQQHKDRKLAIVNELGGQYEETFNDVKTVRYIYIYISNTS